MDIIRYHFETIGSTNTWAKQNAHLMERGKISLVTADEQTAGRGRFNRVWVSPKGENIYATFCFYLPLRRDDIGNIPQLLALSCAKTLENSGFQPQLRWPNDILLSDKKVSGILCETTPFDDDLLVIVGIGINVNMSLTYLEEIDRPATSMSVHHGRDFSPSDVLQALERHFISDLTLFLKEGFTPFLALYRQKMAFPHDKLLTFHDNLHLWEGYFHSINDDGSLNLRLPNNEIKTFFAGEFVTGNIPN